MTVHIDEAVSELALEASAPAPEQAHGDEEEWKELERWRTARQRARKDAERTRAEGYGD